jgi:hypothetical protein
MTLVPSLSLVVVVVVVVIVVTLVLSLTLSLTRLSNAPNLKTSLSLKDQVQPSRQSNTGLGNADLDDRLSTLVVGSSDLGTIVCVSTLDHGVVTDLLVALLRPNGSSLLLLLQVANRVVLQPSPDKLLVLSGVYSSGEVVCPSEGVSVADLSVRRESNHGVGDCSIPSGVKVGLVTLEPNGQVVCTGSEGLGVERLGDISNELNLGIID